MKADYVHKDSKTSTNETVSYKITMPLINDEELQRIDNHYNELVDEFTKQFVKEKDMIIAQRIMMNLRKEIKLLLKENQKLKELQCTFQGTGCQNKMKKYKEVIDKAIEFLKGFHNYEKRFKWCEQDYIDTIEELERILKEVE